MSCKHKGDGARNAPTTGHEHPAFGSAAAALTLASIGGIADSAVDTQNDVAIAQALSTGYECFHDDQSIPSEEETDEDLDSRVVPSKKMSRTDCKHSGPAGAQPTTVAASAKADAKPLEAAGTGPDSLPHDSPSPCLVNFKCCSLMRSIVCSFSASSVQVLQSRR